MKKKLLAVILCVLAGLLIALPALAADTFTFSEKSVTMFEGETVSIDITRDGKYADGGEITYKSANPKIATVEADGTVTALLKGNTTITASLVSNGKTLRRTELAVKVWRAVTKVTLSEKKLTVYEPSDPEIVNLLRPIDEDREWERVIVVSVGKTAQLSAVCTPEDATSRKVKYESTDVGVAKVAETSLRGVEAGECDLIISSVQNPDVRQVYHVLVIQPVKKITIEMAEKSISSGSSAQLYAVCTPDNASIQAVTWSSRNPKIATVDDNGIVTGLQKGSATIDATAADGSGVRGSKTIQITQDVTDVEIKNRDQDHIVATGRTINLGVNVMPQSASVRTVNWYSSDESIATVRNGVITGRKAGYCEITVASTSNPDVTDTVLVQVIQMVTRVNVTNEKGMTIRKGESAQITWSVEPADASIKDVTFKSSAPKVLAVDANGIVTGLSRGAANVTVTAADGSRRETSYRVTVTQPVEGVSLDRGLYLVQTGRHTDIRAKVLPGNANNQNVDWEISDPYMASVRQTGASTCRVTGNYSGSTSLTATTQDGGYSASTEIMVGNFDGAILVESLSITDDNRIRLSLRNMSPYTIDRVYFHAACFDTMNQPMVYNRDGVTTGFDGSYPLALGPNAQSVHGQFNFGNFLETGRLGAVTITITGYRFENGQEWTIPEEYQLPSMPAYSRDIWTPTPTPIPTEVPPEYTQNGEVVNG